MKFFFVSLLFGFSVTSPAQNKLSHDDSLLIGTWKGTSICQVRPSACNDEIAAYHITRDSSPNIYHMVLNKVVNGAEEYMGESDYSLDTAKKILRSVNEKYKIIMTFHLKGDKMDGTLALLPDPNKPYRIIKLTKASDK